MTGNISVLSGITPPLHNSVWKQAAWPQRPVSALYYPFFNKSLSNIPTRERVSVWLTLPLGVDTRVIRLFKHYVPHAVLLLGMLEFFVLLFSADSAWLIRAHQISMDPGMRTDRLIPLLSFAIALQASMVAVGAYATEALQSVRFAIARLLVAISLGVIALSVIYFAVPGTTLWRSNSLYAMAISFVLLTFVRTALTRLFGSDAFKRRVLILGAGQRALRLTNLAKRPEAGFLVVGHIDMNDCPSVIPTAINRDHIENLTEHVSRLEAREVVLAIEERRNSMPLADLVRLRTAGVHVNEVSSFLERETGRIDLRSTNPSWLIFSDGFTSGRRLSSFFKRLFDISASLILILIALPLIVMGALAVRFDSRGPAFFRQQRVGLYGKSFELIKLRSMRTDAEADGKAQWAQENDPRITRIGKWLRMSRVDELPQIWSVLKGDMSFVGPRPERPEFVTDLEDKLTYYAERHMVKPGITGWAQINYPYGASLQDARAKLEYDLYYAKNYTPFLDLLILLQTLRVVLWPEGAR
jgi:sugar transferase (PEP-CTERM system associated)